MYAAAGGRPQPPAGRSIAAVALVLFFIYTVLFGQWTVMLCASWAAASAAFGIAASYHIFATANRATLLAARTQVLVGCATALPAVATLFAVLAVLSIGPETIARQSQSWHWLVLAFTATCLLAPGLLLAWRSRAGVATRVLACFPGAAAIALSLYALRADALRVSGQLALMGIYAALVGAAWAALHSHAAQVGRREQ